MDGRAKGSLVELSSNDEELDRPLASLSITIHEDIRLSNLTELTEYSLQILASGIVVQSANEETEFRIGSIGEGGV